MKIAIVVLNYNGLKDTKECISSLKVLKPGDFTTEIIVVDNDSGDQSKETFKRQTGITFISNSKNLGFSGGNNVGIKKALEMGADAILILNNDTFVASSMLVELVRSLERADIISPKIYFAPGFEFHKSRYAKAEKGKVIWYAGARIDWENIIGMHTGVDEVDRGQFSKASEIDFATGAAMIVKKEVFEKIGFFDEKYFLYLEDMDFCVRAKNYNFKILFEPKAIVWHKNAKSAGGSGSRIQDYYFTRNRLLFAVKYAKLRTKFAVFRQTLKSLREPTKRKAVIDFLMLKFGKGNIK